MLLLPQITFNSFQTFSEISSQLSSQKYCFGFLALLVFTQQSYCHGAGIRHPSSVRHLPVNPGFSETAAWIQTKFYGMLPISTISPDFFVFFQNFQFLHFYNIKFGYFDELPKIKNFVAL